MMLIHCSHLTPTESVRGKKAQQDIYVLLLEDRQQVETRGMRDIWSHQKWFEITNVSSAITPVFHPCSTVANKHC